MSVNKVLLLGRLGQDVELKYTQSGTGVANFSLATSEKYKKDNEDVEKTEWHRVVVWGKLAELCNQYIGKGSQVYIEGKLQTRQWEDKDNNKRYTTEVVASTIQFLGAKQSASESPTGPQVDASFTGDDIPF